MTATSRLVWKSFEHHSVNNVIFFQIYGRGPRSDLIVTPLSLQYYGRYTCKAENPHGKAQHEIELHEAREPSNVQQVKNIEFNPIFKVF